MANRRTLVLAGLALAGALLAALPAPAYIIILRDGTRLEAAAKPVMSGKNYLFYDKLGAQKMIAVSEVDPAKTDAANKENYRDAYILGQPEPMKKESATAAKSPSLSEYIKQNRKSEIAPPPVSAPAVPAEPEAEPRAATRAASRAAEAPAAASPTVLDPVVQESFLRAYQAAAVRGIRITQASAGTVRVQAVTDSETIVFGALVGTARGLKEARTAGRLLERVELYMANSAGENAGRFVVTPEDAEALLNGTTPPAKFFVANVAL